MSIDVYDGTRPRSSPPVIEPDRKNGVRRSPSRCVGANAFRRLRGVRDARVGARIVRLLTRNGWERLELEKNTQAAIKAYDTADEVMPVGFVFHCVPPSEPLGSRSGEKPGSDRRSGAAKNVATRSPSQRHIDVEPKS